MLMAKHDPITHSYIKPEFHPQARIFLNKKYMLLYLRKHIFKNALIVIEYSALLYPLLTLCIKCTFYINKCMKQKKSSSEPTTRWGTTEKKKITSWFLSHQPRTGRRYNRTSCLDSCSWPTGQRPDMAPTSILSELQRCSWCLVCMLNEALDLYLYDIIHC